MDPDSADQEKIILAMGRDRDRKARDMNESLIFDC